MNPCPGDHPGLLHEPLCLNLKMLCLHGILGRGSSLTFERVNICVRVSQMVKTLR